MPDRAFREGVHLEGVHLEGFICICYQICIAQMLSGYVIYTLSGYAIEYVT